MSSKNESLNLSEVGKRLLRVLPGMTHARRTTDRTPTPCRIRVHEGGRHSRHQARESERQFGMKRGATCGCSRRDIPYPYAASSRLDREKCARCDTLAPTPLRS